MSQSDAIGTLATVAAVEAVSTALGEKCRNCGEPLTGTFCASCGQSVKDRSKSILQVVREALADFTHFDSRVLRTLGSLLFLPGRMTRDYFDGRRTRYVPPLRLYLFCSLFFFLCLSFANIALVAIELVKEPGAKETAISATVAGQPRGAVAWGLGPAGVGGAGTGATADSDAGTQVLLPPGIGARLRFFVDLDDWHPQIRAADLPLGWAGAISAPSSPAPPGPVPPGPLPPGRTGTDPAATAVPAPFTGAAKAEMAGLDAVLAPLFGDGWTERLARGFTTSLDHPESLNRVLGDNIAKMLFVTMPLFAVLLALLYWRSRLYFVDHLFFALNVHALLFVVLTLIVLVRELGGLNVLEAAEGAQWLFAGLAGYGWLALKVAYGQGAVRTTVKWLLLGGCYGVVLLFGLIGVMMVSLPEV